MGNRNVIHLCSIEFDYQIKANSSSFQIEPEQTNKQTKNKTQKISLFDICHYFAEKIKIHHKSNFLPILREHIELLTSCNFGLEVKSFVTDSFIVAFICSFGRRTNVLNVSLSNSLRWPIHYHLSVQLIKLNYLPPSHRRSITVSVETYLFPFAIINSQVSSIVTQNRAQKE